MGNAIRPKRLAFLLASLAICIGAQAQAAAGSAEIDLADPSEHDTQDPADQGYQVYARVLKVTPIISRTEVSEPVETCRLVSSSRHAASSRHRHKQPPGRVLRSIVGSLIGGAIGNQVGDGRGRKAATIAGALAGAHIANRGGQEHQRNRHYDDYRNDGRYGREVIEQCTQTDRIRHVEQIDGYRVRYRYNGQTFSKIMDHDPGEELALTARISPQNRSYDPQ